HRFYKEDNIKGIRKGVISAEHFEPPKKLKEKVYLGKFKRLNRPDDRFQYDNKIWYEDLNVLAEALKNGQKPWIYYEEFDGKTTNIGKNFLFKALFLHEDTVPEGNSECKDHSGNMCPRCRMFGMTDKTEDKNDSIGFKGRFKASALVNNYEIEEGRETKHIKFGDITAPLKTWVDKTAGKLIAQQEFLPISGPPKPNKRDIDGYYNERAGRIKGAKYYLHGKLDSARNINNIDENNDYTHRLRSYAQVCESGVQFAGTIGAENCTPEEIAAFLILLHSDISSHGFKIGIGKALGMGTVKSSINNIWIRTQKDYDHWISISTENHVTDEMIKKLEGNIPDISEKFSLLKKVTEQTAHILNSMKDMNKRSLSYPSPEKKKNPEQMQYWDLFNSRRLK
ncbi:MAG: hypothetical protein WCQ90_15985, partial [Deltaproteobacteria bacterium]